MRGWISELIVHQLSEETERKGSFCDPFFRKRMIFNFEKKGGAFAPSLITVTRDKAIPMLIVIDDIFHYAALLNQKETRYVCGGVHPDIKQGMVKCLFSHPLRK